MARYRDLRRIDHVAEVVTDLVYVVLFLALLWLFSTLMNAAFPHVAARRLHLLTHPGGTSSEVPDARVPSVLALPRPSLVPEVLPAAAVEDAGGRSDRPGECLPSPLASPRPPGHVGKRLGMGEVER